MWRLNVRLNVNKPQGNGSTPVMLIYGFVVVGFVFCSHCSNSLATLLCYRPYRRLPVSHRLLLGLLRLHRLLLHRICGALPVVGAVHESSISFCCICASAYWCFWYSLWALCRALHHLLQILRAPHVASSAGSHRCLSFAAAISAACFRTFAYYIAFICFVCPCSLAFACCCFRLFLIYLPMTQLLAGVATFHSSHSIWCFFSLSHFEFLFPFLITTTSLKGIIYFICFFHFTIMFLITFFSFVLLVYGGYLYHCGRVLAHSAMPFSFCTCVFCPALLLLCSHEAFSFGFVDCI